MSRTMSDSRIAPVFQILAEDIHALGVRTVFGLMSDDTAVFAVTLDGLGVKFVGARHENNAIAMAEEPGVPALGADVARELMERAVELGHGKDYWPVLLRAIEDVAARKK